MTGASSGIGRATAEAFVARGYATALLDRDADDGRVVERQLRKSGECLFIQCDVTDDAAVREAVASTVGAYGRLDAAFNAAGIDGEAGKTAECSMENWNRVIATDLTGLWSCMRYEIPQMLKAGGGSIVNCASVAGLLGAPTLPAYVAAKHGVVGLTKTAALEYARQGIRANAVCPGLIDTPMSRKGLTLEFAARLVEESPIGRFGQPAEIAAAVVWLCDRAQDFSPARPLRWTGLGPRADLLPRAGGACR